MPSMLGRLKKRMGSRSSHASNSNHGSVVDASTESSTSRTERVQQKLGLKTTTNTALTQVSNTKVEELAAFDACVEACDALAASSTYAQSSGKKDPETGLLDCSVLVSPDGNLLIIPQDKHEQQQATSPFRATIDFAETDEYASAVVMGNDLKPDKTINGFSAMGWSPSATSLALRQTSQSLKEMTSFVEQLILSRKEIAAREQHACDVLRSAAGISSQGTIPPMPVPRALRQDSVPAKNKSRWRTTSSDSNNNGDYENMTELQSSHPLVPNEYNRESTTLLLSNDRVGPLNYPGGTLHAATVAMENYHSEMAEHDSIRWKRASMSSQGGSEGVLPALKRAWDQTADRAYRRECALREMQARAAATEQLLQQKKIEAMQRWDEVHAAEEQVTRIVEERMMERRKERERRRMEKFQQEEDKRIAETDGELGATAGEIWDIVSAVAESMEDGSFAPTGLPDAPVGGPRDQSQGDEAVTDDSSEKDTRPGGNEEIPEVPMASRIEIEYECQLPEKRRAALAADEAIEDTAGSLLNILSTLDTTRRSARVAAETCLLSAGHAQAECIRSLIALERASIEDRLQNIGALERMAENIDLRADLDAYISADKKERGGSTWLGDDDDGGVASALAILSSHVEGSMGIPSSSKVSAEGWGTFAEEDDITPERLEDAVDDLFAKNELLLDTASDSTDAARRAHETYDANVNFLCVVAQDEFARSRRSTICYALNSKRSSNAEIASKIQFDGLCKLFSAILSGCDREPGGVAIAKMCMMLAQTFYMIDQEDKDAAASQHSSDSSVARDKRIFIKHRISGHLIWQDEEFWDQALYQCVSESLTHSGVMANFDTKRQMIHAQSEWTETRKMKWHDLNQKDRSEAAAQVHAVVFAQLGALAHSMMEFGCGLERSCAFVRRMSIRNQLPISQRTMLLQHLMRGENKSKNES